MTIDPHSFAPFLNRMTPFARWSVERSEHERSTIFSYDCKALVRYRITDALIEDVKDASIIFNMLMRGYEEHAVTNNLVPLINPLHHDEASFAEAQMLAWGERLQQLLRG